MARPATNHEARKAAILDAALDSFTRHGYDGATNKIIAEAAGMKSAGIIYHYFPSKEDLFQACLDRVTAFDTMRDAVVSGQDEPPEVFLHRVARTYLNVMRSDRRLVKLVLMIFSAVQSHPELPPIALRRLMPAFILPLLTYFQRQVDLEVLRPLPPLNAALQFFAPLAMRAITIQVLPSAIPLPQVSDDEFVGHLVRTFLDGVRVRGDDQPKGGHLE
jgi:AcrR family transcriptional regulator